MIDSAFKRKVWKYYKDHGRHDLPWRKRLTPYRVLVSEMMLQQTQVTRVIGKFNVFLRDYPTVSALAAAPLADVLRAWQGLGYNRRAKYLHRTASIITHDLHRKFPKTARELQTLPGIGLNTAGAIIAYAYNQPVEFIETNIRRVFIHEFFAGKEKVSDAMILPLIHSCIVQEKNPREWYWALMDYGAMLGKDASLLNPNRQSKHYNVQSKFEGSRRQVRGKILKYLLGQSKFQTNQLISLQIDVDTARVQEALNQLVSEGLIRNVKGKYGVF